MEVSTIAKDELFINEQIRDKEVRLIDAEGNQQGVVSLDVAMRMADEAGLDLVKIAPNAVPPVCKVMDYGKYKYAIKFFTNGDKVKVSIRFRGRQAKHGDIGLDVMNTFYEMVKDNAAIDRPAKQEGRNMFMILTPKNN